MNLRLLILCTILACTASQAAQPELRATIMSLIRHVHRMILLVKKRFEVMCNDALPMIIKIADDNPDFARELKQLVETLRDYYHNERFAYFQDDIQVLFYSIVQPLVAGDNKCINSANNQIGGIQSHSELSKTIRDRLIVIEKKIKDTEGLVDVIMDTLLDLTEEAITSGKKCGSTASSKVIPCLHQSIVPWAKGIDAVAKSEDTQELLYWFKEIASDFSTAGGNVTGMVEPMIQDAWNEYATCMGETPGKKKRTGEKKLKRCKHVGDKRRD